MLQVSTRGDFQNQIRVWKYPGLTQLVSLTAHSARVLYMAVSPDGEAVVTGGGDETLRFWAMFSKPHSQKVSAEFIHWGKIFFRGSHFFKMTFIRREIYDKYVYGFQLLF
jgi:cell division cycle 20-like protein 1 (cofactor of APC complex)